MKLWRERPSLAFGAVRIMTCSTPITHRCAGRTGPLCAGGRPGALSARERRHNLHKCRRVSVFCPALRAAARQRVATGGAELPARDAFVPALSAAHRLTPPRQRPTLCIIRRRLATSRRKPISLSSTAVRRAGSTARTLSPWVKRQATTEVRARAFASRHRKPR